MKTALLPLTLVQVTIHRFNVLSTEEERITKFFCFHQGDDLPGRDTPAIFNSGENPEEPTCPSSSEHRRAQIISPNPPVEIPGEQSPNTQFTANLSTNSNSPLKHRWFGLKQEKERKVQTHPTAGLYSFYRNLLHNPYSLWISQL